MNISEIHPFEQANLGKAPFRFVGMSESVYQACHGAPVQPGSSCDYCGQGIRYVFSVLSADGKRFKVGIDCINRLNSKTNRASGADRLVIDAARAEREFRRQQKNNKVAARVATAKQILDANPSLLTDRPSRYQWHAAQGRTERQTVEWLLDNAGNKGKTEACILIERAAA